MKYRNGKSKRNNNYVCNWMIPSAMLSRNVADCIYFESEE